jgi:hypothetical protein
MISAAGSEVGGQSKKGFKDDLQEKVGIPSGPVPTEGRAGLVLGPGSHFGGRGPLPVNGHRDCNILVRYVSGEFTNIL